MPKVQYTFCESGHVYLPCSCEVFVLLWFLQILLAVQNLPIILLRYSPGSLLVHMQMG